MFTIVYLKQTMFEVSVAAILLLQFMVHAMQFSVINVWQFYFAKYVCSVKYGCFLKFLNFVLFRYVAEVFSESRDGCSSPFIADITFICAFHTLRMSIVSASKFKIFSFYFYIIFIPPEIGNAY
jgi:hypothetical protein